MADEKQICRMSEIQRALGIIEGVMMLSDQKAEQALASAVEMIDRAVEGVIEDAE